MTLQNVVNGSTTGVLTLNQNAIGGKGGDSGGLFLAAIGDAESDLTALDTQANAYNAARGAGRNRIGPTCGKGGGYATVNANLTAANAVNLAANAIGGAGGNHDSRVAAAGPFLDGSWNSSLPITPAIAAT